MVNITSKKCEHCGNHKPIFGNKGDARATRCGNCKDPSMVNIVSRTCERCGEHQPVFGNEGDARPTRCGKCKDDTMVDIRSRMCERCGERQPAFGNEGDARATLCSNCKDDSMVNFKKNRMCERCGEHQPRFGNEGDTQATRCGNCKDNSMVNFKCTKCEVEGCTFFAAAGGTLFKHRCISHGGGYRCETGAHAEDIPPRAKYKLSENAVSYGADGASHPRPEWAGKKCCLTCLKHLDPSNVAVKVYIRKEHLVVSQIASEFIRRGHGDLVNATSGIMTNDCPSGPSMRRSDLDIDLGPGLLCTFENDEVSPCVFDPLARTARLRPTACASQPHRNIAAEPARR